MRLQHEEVARVSDGYSLHRFAYARRQPVSRPSAEHHSLDEPVFVPEGFVGHHERASQNRRLADVLFAAQDCRDNGVCRAVFPLGKQHRVDCPTTGGAGDGGGDALHVAGFVHSLEDGGVVAGQSTYVVYDRRCFFGRTHLQQVHVAETKVRWAVLPAARIVWSFRTRVLHFSGQPDLSRASDFRLRHLEIGKRRSSQKLEVRCAKVISILSQTVQLRLRQRYSLVGRVLCQTLVLPPGKPRHQPQRRERRNSADQYQTSPKTHPCLPNPPRHPSSSLSLLDFLPPSCAIRGRVAAAPAQQVSP